MTSSLLEAFSDGVIAVIITIMVLDLKSPADPSLQSLINLSPAFTTYLLSFLIISMYWVFHHFLLDSVRRVDALMLWANLNLLFWLSLFPWVTSYLNGHHFRASL